MRVRQAMLYAIDRKMVLEQLLKGKGEVVDGFLSSASPFYDDSIVPVEQDVEKAKELLTGTDMKIYEVACAVGYPDQKYFSKVFKEYVGVSAKQFALKTVK